MSAWIFVLNGLLSAVVLMAALPPAHAAERGWILSQMRGTARTSLSVCASGIKYGPDENGDFFVSHAPGWVLYRFSDRDRSACAVPFKEIEARRKGLPSLNTLPDGPEVPRGLLTVLGSQEYKKGDATTIAGIPVVLYTSPRGRDVSEIALAKDIVLPAKANALCDFLYGTPVGIHADNRVLLRRQVVDKRGNRNTFLSTTVARPAQLLPETFDVPKGYRLVRGN